MAHLIVCPACETRIVAAGPTPTCPHCLAPIDPGTWKQIKTGEAPASVVAAASPQPPEDRWEEIEIRPPAAQPRSIEEFFAARRPHTDPTIEIPRSPRIGFSTPASPSRSRMPSR